MKSGDAEWLLQDSNEDGEDWKIVQLSFLMINNFLLLF